MYTPPAFDQGDRDTLNALIRENSFAVLASTTPDGMLASHLPVMLEAEDDGPGTLVGHMARANPHWRALELNPAALMIFSGPHAYVSPSWYATRPAVPTWNYIAVHAYGRVSSIDDPESLDRLIARMVATYEPQRPDAWRYDSLPEEFKRQQLKGIVGFRMKIDRLEGKLKLSQNRPDGDAERVASTLAASPDAGAQATAAAMRRFGVVGGGE